MTRLIKALAFFAILTAKFSQYVDADGPGIDPGINGVGRSVMAFGLGSYRQAFQI
jgi:hypothetical protein